MKNKKMNRRKFVQATAATAATAAAASTLTGCSTFSGSGGDRNPSEYVLNVNESDRFDFIVVGSGAGGGPLAAGLAKEGFTVLLLEAGGSANDDLSKTPVFHAKASEDALLNWSYYVDRYAEEGRFRAMEFLNSKYRQAEKGVFYPRAAGIGGCTRVNALISLYPDHQDWNNIATKTGDASWSAREMYRIFQSMQRSNGGWLKLSQANPLTLAKDWFLAKTAVSALAIDKADSFLDTLNRLKNFDFGVLGQQIAKDTNLKLDPNSLAYLNNKYNGVFNIPFNATDGVRNGVREHILETERQNPNKLFIKTESLCTRVLFDENNKTKVIGIEFIEGAHAYKADVMNQSKTQSSYVRKKAYAAKEVILASGAFNTPQLLMLSGVGDSQQLGKFGIPLVKNLPGVGRNLQDRYEVTVVSELKQPISVIKDCTFARNNNFAADPCWSEYVKNPSGHIYGTNGVALSLIRKSSAQQATPDLCIFAVPGYFKGYYPGYSADAVPKKAGDPNYFTWAILKGHTKNHAGMITLKSTDPRDTAKINFKYFNDPQGGANEDLNAVFAGLKMARTLNSAVGSDFIKNEVYPGPAVQSEKDLKSWIMKESWGHHASCTNKMGLASDPMAVVDSQFRVHGLQGLRVVDASVYPDIPGLFIMLPTLMVSEKAKEMIIKQYKG
jgi:choline dehydrogenase